MRHLAWALCAGVVLTGCSAVSASPAADQNAPVSPLVVPAGEEYALPTTQFVPDDPAACRLPAVAPSDNLQRQVQVFFSCTTATGVRTVAARLVPVAAGEDPKHAAIRALLAGATTEEANAGYYSFFGADTSAIPFSVVMEADGLAIVSVDPAIRTVVRDTGGSKIRAFVGDEDTAQIVTTLGQFPDVQRVAVFIGTTPLCKAIEAC